MKNQSIKARIQHIDRKGQIVIPKSVREEAGIADDCYVYVRAGGRGSVVIQYVGDLRQFLEGMDGSLKKRAARRRGRRK